MHTICARQTVRHANSRTHWAKWWGKWHRVTHQPRPTLSYSCPCCVCVTSKRIIHLHVWPLKCAAHRSALQPSITIGFPVTSSNSDKSMTSCLANAATHSVPLNQFQTTKVKLQKKSMQESHFSIYTPIQTVCFFVKDCHWIGWVDFPN